MARLTYRELARADIGLNKSIVISKRSDGRISIAQQVEAETDDGPIRMYLSNAISTDDGGLTRLKEAIDKAVEQSQRVSTNS